MSSDIVLLVMASLLVSTNTVVSSPAPKPEAESSGSEQPLVNMSENIFVHDFRAQSSPDSPYGSQHHPERHRQQQRKTYPSRDLSLRSEQYRLRRSQPAMLGQNDAAILTQLIEHVSQLSASVASLSNEVSDLRSQNDVLRRNVTALEARNSALVAELTQLSQVTRNDVGGLKSQTKDLQQNLTTLQTQQVALDVELGQSAQTIHQQGTALQAIFAQFADFRRDADQSSHQQNDSLVQLNKAVSGVQTSVASLQHLQNLIDSTFLSHTARMDQLEPRLTSVEIKTAQIEKQTENLAGWRTNVTGDFSMLEMTQVRLANDVLRVKEEGKQAAAESSRLQGDLLQMANKLADSSRSVVFYANLSDNTQWPQPPPPFPIILDQALTNEGRAYNTSTGVFTVPMDGFYFFAAVSVSAGHGGSPRMELMVDDDRLFITGLDYAAIEASLRLRAGQRVWLRSFFSSRYGRGMYFTGFLIRPILS